MSAAALRACWPAAALAAVCARPACAQAAPPPGPAPSAWVLAPAAGRDAAADAWVPQLSSAARVRWLRRGRVG
ncbi:MAG: hypothetical protein ACJ8J0_28105, partial [Longimicrobiaceae bacterium]